VGVWTYYDVQKLVRYVQIQRPDVLIIRPNFYVWRKRTSKNNVQALIFEFKKLRQTLGLMTVIAFV